MGRKRDVAPRNGLTIGRSITADGLPVLAGPVVVAGDWAGSFASRLW